MSNETAPKGNPESRRKPTAANKVAVFAARKALEISVGILLGKDQLPSVIKGLCEHAILASHLCSPNEPESHLDYKHAHTGQWLAHDFRRAEFYPQSANKPWFKKDQEGILYAMVIDGIADIDPDQRTDLPLKEWLTADNVLSIDKPGIEKLLALGMVARRSHELAYEIAGQEQWIDELRSRGLADDPVYQITPKAHSLVRLSEDGGEKTPKPTPKLQLSSLPAGVIFH